MKDDRISRLAHTICTYSTELKPGDKIYIEWKGLDAGHLAKQVIKQSTQCGAIPFPFMNDESNFRNFLLNGSEEQFKGYCDLQMQLMQKMDAYVAIRGSDNVYELSDISREKMELFMKYFKPVQQQRIDKTRWVVMRYPNFAMAQLAEMPQELFEDFYFDVCNTDYEALSRSMDHVLKRLEGVDQVRLVSPGTELTFSIRDIPRIKCDGKVNIPDGEIFTAPVRDSINGVIQFNTPTVYNGKPFADVRLEFKDGKVVKASCSNDTQGLNNILDTDEGARYTGEFAIGLNPNINRPMRDILFDEKINGSIHLTPGQCYEVAPNGNNSKIHWDLVLIQTPEFGGGEMYFDGQLVRKNGKFLF